MHAPAHRVAPPALCCPRRRTLWPQAPRREFIRWPYWLARQDPPDWSPAIHWKRASLKVGGTTHANCSLLPRRDLHARRQFALEGCAIRAAALADDRRAAKVGIAAGGADPTACKHPHDVGAADHAHHPLASHDG